MRTLAVVAALCATSVLAAKRRPKASKPDPSPAARLEAERSSGRAAPSPARPWREEGATGAVGLGAFYGGGLNRGPVVRASVTLRRPQLSERLALDVEVDWRLSQFRRQVAGGTVTSSLHALPLYAALRMHLADLGPLALDLRGGLGPLFSLHHLSSSFFAPATRTSVGWEAFAGTELCYPMGPFVLAADVRYGLGEAPIPFVLGRATGVQAGLSARFGLP